MPAKSVTTGIALSLVCLFLLGAMPIIANLRPATIRGVESQGMILAAGDDQILGLSAIDREVPPGTKVR